MQDSENRKPFLIILSAPSGGGKSTILKRILAEFPDMVYSVSTTTRPPRGSEQNGVAYFFVTEQEFEEKIRQGEFLEHANVFGYHYGTSRKFIQSCFAHGHHVIMDIDVQGAMQINTTDFNIIRIFILPPAMSVLKQRLEDRKTDSPDVITKRLLTALQEIAFISRYDYLVFNEDLEKAVAQVKHIIQAEELRTTDYKDLDALIHQWEAQ